MILDVQSIEFFWLTRPSPSARSRMKSPASFIAIMSERTSAHDFPHELPIPRPASKASRLLRIYLAEGERLNEQINRSWHHLKGCWENFRPSPKPTTDPTTDHAGALVFRSFRNSVSVA
jgi:hypothetical protein